MLNYDVWREQAAKKKSCICAGIDPAPAGMDRGKSGLPEDVSRRDWALRYIEAVNPFVSAFKINFKYWLFDPALPEIMEFIKSLETPLIIDSKIADIGDTNDAEFYFQQAHGADALTLSPLPGNIEASVKGCLKRGAGCFVMGLMSNPEFAIVKQSLFPILTEQSTEFAIEDIVRIGEKTYVPAYIYLIAEAVRYGATGSVVGTTGHISRQELEKAKSYLRTDSLLLCPGIGHQGGDVALLREIFPPDNLIFNVGRALMFPHGSSSTSEDQANAAAHFRALASV